MPSDRTMLILVAITLVLLGLLSSALEAPVNCAGLDVITVFDNCSVPR
jgi:hypothetical protein